MLVHSHGNRLAKLFMLFLNRTITFLLHVPDSEEEGVSYDNRHLYVRACRQFDVIPSHAFVRQVDDKIADVSYSMLETLDIKALCVALTVRQM